MNENSVIPIVAVILAVLMPPIGLIVTLCFKNHFTNEQNKGLMKIALIISTILTLLAVIGIIVWISVVSSAVNSSTKIINDAFEMMNR